MTINADLVVTFHRRKLGHVLHDPGSVVGPEYFAKKVVTVDIGLTEGCALAVEDFGPPLWGIGKDAGHKYAHGHALILSGPSGRGGAARLAARGALRIGAGVVTLGCPPDAIPENAARLDAVMLREVADGAALAGALQDRRITALCLGPGMGTGAREAGLLAAALGLPATPPPPSPPHEGEGGRDGQPPRADNTTEALPLPLVGRGKGRGAAPSAPDASARPPATPNPPASPDNQPPRAGDTAEALPLPLVGRGEGRGPSPSKVKIP